HRSSRRLSAVRRSVTVPTSFLGNAARKTSSAIAPVTGKVLAIVRRFAPVAFVALASLVPVKWLFGQLPLKGVDSMFSLHQQVRVLATLWASAWDARFSVGEP